MFRTIDTNRGQKKPKKAVSKVMTSPVD